MRDERLDAMRGAACVLVVLDHALIYTFGWDWFAGSLIGRMIMALDMPAFAFVAGYFFKPDLKRKLLALGLPYLLWTLIWNWRTPLDHLHALWDPYGSQLTWHHPWFLYVLLLCCVLGMLPRNMQWAVAGMCIALKAYGVDGHLFGLAGVLWLFPAFLGGQEMHRSDLSRLSLVAVPVFAASLYIPPTLNLVTAVASLVLSMAAGVLTLYNAPRFLAPIGRRSLGVWLAHGWFLHFGLGTGWEMALTKTAIALGAAFVVAWLLERNQWSAAILLGRRWPKKPLGDVHGRANDTVRSQDGVPQPEAGSA